MQNIRNKWDGDFVAEEAVELHGMIAGNVFVRPGVTMIVHGMVCGDLEAAKGATVVINGMVNGAIRNLGAEVRIDGVVDSVEDLGEQATRIGRDAVVRDRQTPLD